MTGVSAVAATNLLCTGAILSANRTVSMLMKKPFLATMVVLAFLSIPVCSFYSWSRGKVMGRAQASCKSFGLYSRLLSSGVIPTNTPLHEFVRARYYHLALSALTFDLQQSYVDAGPINTQMLANLQCGGTKSADQEYLQFLRRTRRLKREKRAHTSH